ncbi:leucyl/phenylalanyl-tRNA--protein transferase [Polaribacter pacificus]|uniref:Leucyl/phenylalanyl-tRNA--protein transferase n=1 Tax=Polaribacter pacificus TaxID=1775173 RepID=A0A917MD06_9FLAO|nr:leucyl/phenylalanyl-tRNA--protein transferase [Polaribacter pacificus]GGG95364.1 leucyl/phenylalanyl-tRNA--protein transferase [Polaribacter pacificus]
MIWLSEKIEFPAPETATQDGIIALGGDLSEERLIYAYQHGIFPWFSQDDPIVWYCPPERMVLYPNEIKISKSMRKVVADPSFSITENTAFDQVIHQCKSIKRKDEEGTWITNDMEEAYKKLHLRGVAKSIEVWKITTEDSQQRELVGGLYGVDLGNGVFCGESMFSKLSNTSKLAFVYLATQLSYKLIDCQVYNEHLASLGAREISRDKFLSLLKG